MPNDLARKTISTIQNALENNSQATAINEVIQIIQELASKAFSISVSELSELISRDSSITEKVISSANTLGFNPSGVQISTITQAIHTIGFEKIRNLSISILLVENAGKNLNSEEQREMASMSVCSGLMAQQLVDQIGSDISPEFAFVCSSLRNYGKLLMTTFLVDDYKEAKSKAQQTRDYDESFKEVFGLTPLKLGQILLQSSNLPKSIMNAMKEIDPEVLELASKTPEDEICLLADFCVQVCEVTFDDSIPPEEFNSALEGVIGKFEKCLPISLEMVNMSLVQIDTNVSVFNRAVGLNDVNSPLSIGVKARIMGRPIPARERPPQKIIPKEKAPEKPSEDDIRKKAEEERNDLTENIYKQAMGLILRKREPGETVNLREIYDSVAEMTLSSLDVESVMIFIEEADKKSLFAARHGSGKVFKNIKNRSVVSELNKDVFSICLMKKEDILIQDINAGKIRSVIPDWLTLHSPAKSIALFPLLKGTDLFALIVCTGHKDQSIKLDKNDLRRMKSMRSSLALLKKQIDGGLLISA